MKKLLLTIICGLFLFNALQAQVEKAFDFSSICESGQTLYYEIKTGNTVSLKGPEFKPGHGCGYWTSTQPKGHVVIPSKVTNDGITYTVVEVGYRAFYCCDIESVIIPNTVVSIGSDAFNFCKILKAIVIPNSVKEIGGGAFQSCSALRSITIPNSVKKIGHKAFAYSGLKSIKFPNAMKEIHPYDNCQCVRCEDLESVVLPADLQVIPASMFESCHNLRTITIPNSVKRIENCAFLNCISLSVKVPNTVTYVGDNGGANFNRVFENCLNVIYNGKLKGAPWGAKCLNGYVEGDCVYKDKTMSALVYCKPSENARVATQSNTSTNRTSSTGGSVRQTIIVNESNVRDRIKEMKSFYSHDDLYYNVYFKSGQSGSIRYSSLNNHWQYSSCLGPEGLLQAYYGSQHDTELGALVDCYKAVHKYVKEYGYE